MVKRGLYIKANPKREEDSNSLRVGRHLADAIRRRPERVVLEEIDVYRQPIPLIDGAFLSAREKVAGGAAPEQLEPEERASVERIHRFTDAFIAADFYIFAYPLWNFGVPPLLKAYIDTIKVARRTFRYTPEGPVGLLKDKTAILIQSSGDVYSRGPLEPFEHGSRYLRSVLSFIGVERITTILMEGMDTAREDRESKRRRAMEQAELAAASLFAESG